MIKTGMFKTVAIAQNGTTSSEVDLGAEFQDVQVYNPALDSATITIQVLRTSGGTAVASYTLSRTATGDYANATTARTGAGMNIFKDICARYVKVVVGAAQTSAERTFYIRGINSLD